MGELEGKGQIYLGTETFVASLTKSLELKEGKYSVNPVSQVFGVVPDPEKGQGISSFLVGLRDEPDYKERG